MIKHINAETQKGASGLRLLRLRSLPNPTLRQETQHFPSIFQRDPLRCSGGTLHPRLQCCGPLHTAAASHVFGRSDTNVALSEIHKSASHDTSSYINYVGTHPPRTFSCRLSITAASPYEAGHSVSKSSHAVLFFLEKFPSTLFYQLCAEL